MNKFGKKLIAAGICVSMAAAALTGCSSINKDAVVATMDGEEIALGEVNFMLRYQQPTMESYLGSFLGEDFWNQDLTGSGVAYGETFKESVINEMRDLLVLEKHASEYNVEITDEEKAAIDQAAQLFLESNDEKVLEAMMATEETVSRVLTLNTIRVKMTDAIQAGVDTEVSDEEAAQKTIEYGFFSTGDKEDEEGNAVALTDEEKEEIKQQAQTVIDSVNDGKTLEDAVKEVDEEKTISTMSYGEDDSTITEVLKTAADQLSDREVVKEPVESESGYYVVYMVSTFDQEATDAHKEEIVEQRKTDLYNETLEGWQPESFEINEKVWEKVTFDDQFVMQTEASTEAATEGAEETEGTGEAAGETETADEKEAVSETETETESQTETPGETETEVE